MSTSSRSNGMLSRIDRASEDGSILLTMFVLLVTSGLAVVLLGTALVSSRSTRHDQAFTRAVLVADAGLQQALDQINTGALTLPATDGASTSTQTHAVDSDVVAWAVKRINNLDYQITSTATVLGARRTVTQHLVQGQLVSFAVFANQSVSFQGNNVVGSYTENSAAGAPIDTPPNDQGYVGTNGSISFVGGAKATGVELFNNAGGATCSGSPCTTQPSGFPVSKPYNQHVLDATITSTLAHCPQPLLPYDEALNTPPIHAGINCFSSANFDGPPAGGLAAWPGTPTNPVKIYVDPAGSISISDTGLGTQGPASELQVFTLGNNVYLAHQAIVTGLFWAPQANCAGQPVEGVTVSGSLICNTVGRNFGLMGNGNFTGYFDKALGSIGDGTFSLKHFGEEVTTNLTPGSPAP